MKKHGIPSVITGGNAVCGIIGILAVIFLSMQEISYPLIVLIGFFCILAGAICDVMDGYIARKLNCTSILGEELDSLADLITFGILPAVLAFVNDLHQSVLYIILWSIFLSTVYVISSTVRLARYNAAKGSKEEQFAYFRGLPMPAAAIFLTCWLYVDGLIHFAVLDAIMPLVIGFLMVSSIPYPHFFKKKYSKKRYLIFATFILLCATALFIKNIPIMTATLLLFAVCSTTYVCLGIFKVAAEKGKKIKKRVMREIRG